MSATIPDDVREAVALVASLREDGGQNGATITQR